MTTSSLSIDLSAPLERLAGIEGLNEGQLKQAVTKFMRKEGQKAAGHVIRTQFGKGVKPTYQNNRYTKKRRARTGSLRRSITAELAQENNLPAVEIGVFRGPALKYAGPQEFGTKSYNPQSPYPDITPKNSKFLTIPVGRAVTPAGVPRYASMREYPDKLQPYFFRKVKRSKGADIVGLLFLAEEFEKAQTEEIKYGRRVVDLDKLEAVAILATRTAITPGFYLTDGVRDYLPRFTENLADFLTEYLEGNETPDS